MRAIRVAILECDRPIESLRDRFHGYGQMIQELFEQALEHDEQASPGVNFCFQSWDIYQTGRYPDPHEIDAVILTGSKHDSFNNEPWIVRLLQYIHFFDQHANKVMIGFCFGHQIIARAMGARTARNPSGKELSVCEITLNREGQRIFDRDSLSLFQSHQDMVLTVPSGCRRLGNSDRCEIQGLFKENRILTLQGHPEFSPFIMRTILEAKFAQGTLDEQTFHEALTRVDAKQDGLVVATAICSFLKTAIQCQSED